MASTETARHCKVTEDIAASAVDRTDVKTLVRLWRITIRIQEGCLPNGRLQAERDRLAQRRQRLQCCCIAERPSGQNSNSCKQEFDRQRGTVERTRRAADTERLQRLGAKLAAAISRAVDAE